MQKRDHGNYFPVSRMEPHNLLCWSFIFGKKHPKCPCGALYLPHQVQQGSIMNQGSGNYPSNRGQEGNYGANQGGQQYPSSGNNMQYNYTMNQPYAGNMTEIAYPDQYYAEQAGYGYDANAYEEEDYDNLDEIDRVRSSCQSNCPEVVN